MNEEALQDSFKLFSTQGYNGSIEDYKELMSSNEEALQDSFGIFSSEGYDGSIEDYSELIGVSKKKADSTLETEDTDGTSTEMGGPTSSDSSDQTIDLSILSIGDDADFAAAPIREGVLINKDGKESTHIMAAEQLEDGTWVGFPTLFQNEDKTWVDMSKQAKEDWMPVYEEAKSRGEVKEFGQDSKSAIAYGEGSWKESYNKNKKF